MRVHLPITHDNFNSHPSDELVLDDHGETIEFYISDDFRQIDGEPAGIRKIRVTKTDVLHALAILGQR